MTSVTYETPEATITLPPEYAADDAEAIDAKAFISGYIDALFFTEGLYEEDAIYGAHLDDFAPDTLDELREDCLRFVNEHAPLLRAAFVFAERKGIDYDAERAGADLLFTRNRHGAGYWDRGLGAIGDALSELCRGDTDWPEVTPCMGDDGRVYFC
ncbi:hypothetical protein [Pyruvatibacter mobilis]|uniref:hypothetical protein n=1 Tax=Pyruvatibacter mobilis TaxID=1712261 RepID=UPI003BAA54C5